MTTSDLSTPPTKKPWYKRKRIIIPGAVVVGIIAISAAAGGGNSDTPTATATDAAASAPKATQQVDTDPKVVLPSIVGMTPKQAGDALSKVGVTMNGEDPGDGSVEASDKATGYASYQLGDQVDKGAQIMVEFETPAPPKPTYTAAQENAIGTAEDYLSYQGFSRSGLIKQLEFEKYSTADATFAVDHVGADWNEQAVKVAKDYLDYDHFSHSGLVDQLVFEGFTRAQAEHGAKGAGL